MREMEKDTQKKKAGERFRNRRREKRFKGKQIQ